MVLFIVSFFAGVLTVLAPCILPVLPIIIGGSLADGKRQWLRPLVITSSLAVSIVIFTLLLKFSTAFIAVSPLVWIYISGSILALLGVSMLYPRLWNTFSVVTGIVNKSEGLLAGQAGKGPSLFRDIATGAALGPVFSSCSPTYFFILATVLPRRFGAGVLYLSAYALGLSAMLLLIGILGQKLVRRMRWAANPDAWFKKAIGVLFIVVGIAVMTGIDKRLEAFLIDRNYLNIGVFEEWFLNK